MKNFIKLTMCAPILFFNVAIATPSENKASLNYDRVSGSILSFLENVLVADSEKIEVFGIVRDISHPHTDELARVFLEKMSLTKNKERAITKKIISGYCDHLDTIRNFRDRGVRHIIFFSEYDDTVCFMNQAYKLSYFPKILFYRSNEESAGNKSFLEVKSFSDCSYFSDFYSKFPIIYYKNCGSYDEKIGGF